MRLHFPKLTPLQSRFAASLFASLLLLVIYLFLSHPHAAYAAEADSWHNEDHNHHRLAQDALFNEEHWSDGNPEDEDGSTVGYEPSFFGIDRGIIGRAASDTESLHNDERQTKTISANATDSYIFVFGNTTSRAIKEARAEESENESEHDAHILRRQTNIQAVNFTLAVCFQPTTNMSTDQQPPTLTMSVSTSNDNTNPGSGAVTIPVTEGYASHQSTSGASTIHVTVSAPSLPPGYSGSWNYEIAASTDSLPFHVFDNGTFNGSASPLFLVDSDTTSALMVTRVLSGNTSALQNHTLYVFSTNSSQMRGLSRSYCAANLFSNATAGLNITRSVTQRFANDQDLYHEQFFVEGLTANTNYTAVLALGSSKDSSSPGGGGTIWPARTFTTKTMDNCQLIFDLDFCSNTAYSVPANPNNSNFPNRTALAQWYDNNTYVNYQSFSYTLMQVPCNTTDTAKYSLERNCDDCAHDYKNWLCAVTIPRCTDFNLPDTDHPDAYWYRKPRNLMTPASPNGTTPNLTGMTFYDGYPPDGKQKMVVQNDKVPLYLNSSRVPSIDADGGPQPGPYREILPCVDYCHSIVQSCSSLLAFACPPFSKLRPLQSRSYGVRSQGLGPHGEPTCNYVGALYDVPPSSGTVRNFMVVNWLFLVCTALTMLIIMM